MTWQGAQGDSDPSARRLPERTQALNLVGYEGLSMIAIAGLDMAAWDA